VVGIVLGDGSPAIADNCGDLSDCFKTLESGLWEIAAIAIVVAGVVAFPSVVGPGLFGVGLAGAGAGGATIVIGGAVALPATVPVLVGVAATTAGAASILHMAKATGKESASDIPSWAKGSRAPAQREVRSWELSERTEVGVQQDQEVPRATSGEILMTGTETFENAGIWPVEVRFPHVAGTTLWGDGNSPQGTDRCLAVDDEVVLFETLGALAAFVGGPIVSNLTNTPGYEAIRRVAAAGWPTDVDRVDFTALLRTVREPPASWPRSAVAEVVDSLNLLSDLRDSVDIVPLPASAGPSGYADLVDRLTFLSPDEELETVLRDLDFERIVATVEAVVGAVEARCVVLG